NYHEIDSGQNYGILDDGKNIKCDLIGHVIFSSVDMIRTNGFISNISINVYRLSNMTTTTSINSDLILYIVSPTNESTLFSIIAQFHIPFVLSTNGIQNIPVVELIFIANGQYLAIGFDNNYTSCSFNFEERNQYSANLDDVNQGFKQQKKVQFLYETNKSVAFSFNIVQSPEFLRDLFLWSIFVSRYNMAKCLCSYTSVCTIQRYTVLHKSSDLPVTQES
ncbi:unnamed protein product, partial [Didymodactylos carnosus]